jgi:hypothetical protein
MDGWMDGCEFDAQLSLVRHDVGGGGKLHLGRGPAGLVLGRGPSCPPDLLHGLADMEPCEAALLGRVAEPTSCLVVIRD